MSDLPLVWMGEAPPAVEWKDGEPRPEAPWRAGMAFWSHYEWRLSKHYLEHVRSIRRPITVMLPDRSGPHACGFIIDSHPTDQPDAAWDVQVDLDSLVVGQRPLITVTPSIDCRGIYHGLLRDGILTADLGG